MISQQFAKNYFFKFTLILSSLYSVLHSDTPSFLLILADAPNLCYCSFEGLLDSLSQRPYRAGGEMGHCWVIAEGWIKKEGGKQRVCLEVGHSTNDNGLPSYGDGIMNLVEYGCLQPDNCKMALYPKEKDPVSYLWYNRPDGLLQLGSGGHTPNVAAYALIEDKAFEELIDWVESGGYDFSRYNLTNHQCVFFVLSALQRANISLQLHKVQLKIPSTLKWHGKLIKLRESTDYAIFSFIGVDQLAQAMQEAVGKGVLLPGMALYHKRLNP